MNRGAIALMAWFDDDYAARESLVACTLGLSTETLDRWRLGEAVPGDDEREAIGRLTDGAVLGAMWDQPVEAKPLHVIGVDGGGVDDTGLTVSDLRRPHTRPIFPELPLPALLCELGGPLATLPPGPPFRCITDPMSPGMFVLAGPGVALVLNETLGWAMRDALTIGLQDVRGDRAPVDKPRVAQIG